MTHFLENVNLVPLNLIAETILFRTLLVHLQRERLLLEIIKNFIDMAVPSFAEKSVDSVF